MDKKERMEEWFLRYAKDIKNFLIYYTNQTDVEDFVQECFLRAWKGLDRFAEKSDPKTWLIAIARNVAIDAARKKALWRYLPYSSWKTIKSNAPALETSLILQEEMQELYRAIQQLKRSYRDVVILRGIMELSVEETARILDWSETKVSVTFHRALAKLRTQKKGE
jgi:RNA polymerase sigma-70 factor (ECF subfamily)